MPTPREQAESILADLRAATAALDSRDTSYRERLGALEGTVNNLYKRLDRPANGGEQIERFDAAPLSSCGSSELPEILHPPARAEELFVEDFARPWTAKPVSFDFEPSLRCP